MHTRNDVRVLERTPFSLYESLIIPMTTYLKEQGVDFRFHAMVIDLKLYPASDPTTVSEVLMLENGKKMLITVDPIDIVIVTLGSMSTGMQIGSNREPPPRLPPSLSLDSLQGGEWSLWQRLNQKSSKFGNPSNFFTRSDESKLETFTVTLHDSDFMRCYARLTQDKPGTGALLTVMESPWGLNVSVPRQPVFATQPKIVHVIWGYALHPDRNGTFVKKPMESCSGEEIFLELLSHLGFPTEQLLSSAITIPCLMPLGTSMLLSLTHHDRPSVIPHDTTNMALIGQYVEIPDDTTSSVEYSVRGAQMAVCNLMGLSRGPSRIWKNKLLEVFELML
jgi:oleate hydratase